MQSMEQVRVSTPMPPSAAAPRGIAAAAAEDLRALVLAKAMREPAFRAELLRDGRAALAGHLGIEVPESVNVHVTEESESTLYLVVPFTSAADFAASRLAACEPAEVVAKAINDPAFRARLLAEPKSVIEAEYGVALPEELDLVVLEEDAANVHLVLPSAEEVNLPSPYSEDVVLELAEECSGDSYTMWGGACCTGTCEATANPPVEDCNPE